MAEIIDPQPMFDFPMDFSEEQTAEEPAEEPVKKSSKKQSKASKPAHVFDANDVCKGCGLEKQHLGKSSCAAPYAEPAAVEEPIEL